MNNYSLKIRYCLAIIFSLLLSACATMPSGQSPINQKISLHTRQNQLKRLQSWHIQGAVGVKTSQQATSATIDWLQRKSHYVIHLFGPLGIGAINITGRPGRFILQNAQGKTFKAKTPERLIRTQLGWTLPISNLYYWVRGLPVPNIAAKKRLDKYNHIVLLKQQGWQIHYLQYTSSHSIDLPSKIFLYYPGLELKIIIGNWKKAN